jgi:rubrerythrin
MATEQNLKNAFAGESQANRKYLAFALKAEAEGFPQIGKLFRAAADAETVHAHAHLRAMGGVKTTEENLTEAVEGEGFEFHEMYPPYLKTAEEEGHKAAEVSFRNAMAVEKIHHDLYEEALASLKDGRDLPVVDIYVCGICGNTVKGEPPENCPVCGVPKHMFRKVE